MERVALVEKCLKDAWEIRESIEFLCTTQEHAVLRSLGIEPESPDGSEDDTDIQRTFISPPSDMLHSIPSKPELKVILAQSQYNWFELLHRIMCKCKCDEEEVNLMIDEVENYFTDVVASANLTDDQLVLLQQSHDAFWNDKFWKH